MPYRCTARRMFCGSFSEMNFAEWTPMTTTGSFAKRSSTRFSTGRTCMQLMQQYVQKSRTATRPRRSEATLKGRRVLIQVKPGRNSGQRTRGVDILGIYTPWLRKEREFTAGGAGNRAASAQRALDRSGQPFRLALVAQHGRNRQRPACSARDLQIVIGGHPDLHADLQRDVTDLPRGSRAGPDQTEKIAGDRQTGGTRDDAGTQEDGVERDQHHQKRERHENDTDHAADEDPERVPVQIPWDQCEEEGGGAAEDAGEKGRHQDGLDVPAAGEYEARPPFGDRLDEDARGLRPRGGAGGRRPRFGFRNRSGRG